MTEDNVVRKDSKLESYAKLPPVFDRNHGTITAGNSSPLTDGASALLLMSESKAKAMGYQPLGYLKSWAYAAVDPGWQLLMAPVFAIPKALERARLKLGDIDLVDIHEAFAAQLASNLQALASKKFAAGEARPERGGRRDRSRQAQRQRRIDRHRPPVRRDRRPHGRCRRCASSRNEDSSTGFFPFAPPAGSARP